MPSLPVKPAFRPTLPELAAPVWARLPRWARLAAGAAALLFVLLVAARVLGSGSGGAEKTVVVERPVAFNLRHGTPLKRRAPQTGESLRLEQSRDGLFLQSFVVQPLTLPAYRGDPAGELPVDEELLRDRLARRFAEFQLVSEGRARINSAPGYQMVFKAMQGGRRLYGRWIMVVPADLPGARQGVTIELLGTPAGGIPNADAIGTVGQLKLPLRSFRFGTDTP